MWFDMLLKAGAIIFFIFVYYQIPEANYQLARLIFASVILLLAYQSDKGDLK